MASLFLISTLLFSAMFSPRIWADENACTQAEAEMNLTVDSGSLAPVKPYDQKNTGTCFAVAMSELIDAQRFRDKSNWGSQIAPMELAVLSDKSDPDHHNRLDGGGQLVVAFNTLNANSNDLCERDFLDRLLGTEDDQYEYFGTLENIIKMIRQDELAVCYKLGAPAPASLQDAINQGQQFFSYRPIYHQAPGVGFSQFISDWSEVLLKYEHLNLHELMNFNGSFDKDILRPLFQDLCQGHQIPRKTIPPLTVVGMARDGFDGNLPSRSESEMNNYAWSMLRTPNAQPVGIGFCSEMLKNGSFYVPTIGDEGCQSHAAVLAGTRCSRNGQRQYLIRNSWGANCGDTLSSSLKADCDGRGDVWVDGKSLFQSTFELVRTCRTSDAGCTAPIKP